MNKFLVVIFFTVFFVMSPLKSFAALEITNGEDAIGEIGHLDSDGNLSYTASSSNNSPQNDAFDYTADTVIDTVNHRLFISDSGNRRILVYNLDLTNHLISHDADYILGQSNFNGQEYETSAWGLTRPMGMSYDSVNNRLFVADTNAARVLVFDLSSGITNKMDASYVIGQPNFTSSTFYSSPGQYYLSGPNDVAYDSSTSRLFVSDYNHRVMVYDLSSGITNGMGATYIIGQSSFNGISSGCSSTKFTTPTGLWVDSINQRLFVADTWNSRVLVFNLSGLATGMAATYVLGQANMTDTGGTVGQSKLYMPQALKYDPSSAKLFVADTGNNRIVVYDFVEGIINGMNASYVIGQPGFTSSTSAASQITLKYPIGFDFDLTNGVLYVADNNANRVLVFDLSSGITNGMAASDVLGQTDSDGNISYTKGGSNNSPNKYGFEQALGSSVDTVNHRLFVADEYNNRVLVFNLDSSNKLTDYAADYVLGQSSLVASGNDTSQFQMNDPRGIYFNSENSLLFVADTNNNRVLVFDLSSGITNGMNASYVLGQSDFTSSDSDAGSNYLNGPIDIIFDSANNYLFIADSGNSRVLVFDLSSGITNGMNAAYVLGQSDFDGTDGDITQSTFSGPKQMAYDSVNKRFFVADNGNNRVLVFDLSSGITNGMNASYVLGQSDFATKAYDTTASSFNGTVEGVAYDSDDSSLFVADSYSSRVLVFNLSSGITNGMSASYVLGEPDFVTADWNVSQSSLYGSSFLNYDSLTGYLYVADYANRVMIFAVADPAGSEEETTTTSSSGGNYASADNDGNDDVYTDDSDNDDEEDDNEDEDSDNDNDDSETEDDSDEIADLQEQIAFVMKEVASLQTATQSTQTTIEQFTKNLKFGDIDDQVKQLQVFLNTHGFALAASGVGSSGNETTYFGTLTESAVKQFQQYYAADILTSQGITSPTGWFYSYSRAKANELIMEK